MKKGKYFTCVIWIDITRCRCRGGKKAFQHSNPIHSSLWRELAPPPAPQDWAHHVGGGEGLGCRNPFDSKQRRSHDSCQISLLRADIARGIHGVRLIVSKPDAITIKSTENPTSAHYLKINRHDPKIKKKENKKFTHSHIHR